MSDLDARVAAPDVQQMAEQWHDNETLGGADCDHRALEITAYKAGYAAAIRAELQQPALHEPCAWEEAAKAWHLSNLHHGSAIDRTQVAINSVLQGRAKPATADANFTTGDSDLDTLLELTVDMEQGKGNMDTGIFWLEILEKVKARLAEEKEPAQEKITDAERYRFLRMDAGIRNGRPFIAISSAGGMSQWTGIFADKQVDAAIRASKGEKT